MLYRFNNECYIPLDREELLELCRIKDLNEYETEIIIRKYLCNQSMPYISSNMNFGYYGKSREYYSIRSINYFYKEALAKLLD